MGLNSHRPYRILIISGSGSDKTNMSFNLIKHQRPGIDKTYFYVKDPFESKYQLPINGREKEGIKNLKYLMKMMLLIIGQTTNRQQQIDFLSLIQK